MKIKTAMRIVALVLGVAAVVSSGSAGWAQTAAEKTTAIKSYVVDVAGSKVWVDTNVDASLPVNPHHFYQVLPGQ